MSFFYDVVDKSAGKLLVSHGFSPKKMDDSSLVDFFSKNDGICVRFSVDSVTGWLTIAVGHLYRVIGYDDWVEVPVSFRTLLARIKEYGVLLPEYRLGVGVEEDLREFCKLFPLVYSNLPFVLEKAESDALSEYHSKLEMIKVPRAAEN